MVDWLSSVAKVGADRGYSMVQWYIFPKDRWGSARLTETRHGVSGRTVLIVFFSYLLYPLLLTTAVFGHQLGSCLHGSP